MKIVDEVWQKCLLLIQIAVIIKAAVTPQPEDYHVQNNDGSYQFGYQTKDHFHHGDATRDNFVRGEFGSRNPGTGVVDTVSYTAGPRGFRPRGKNIARKYDLSQVGPRPVGSKDDPYFDPNEDPSYNFAFRTRTYNREEAANRYGDVTGRYTFVDDVGERHNVEYIAGKKTGFHIRTPYPDSNPTSTGPLFYQGPGKPPRGRSSIQRSLDGSYKYGDVTGRYTFVDDVGERHNVEYIAGKKTGFHIRTPYPDSNPTSTGPLFYQGPGKPPRGRSSIQRSLDGSYKFVAAGPDHRRTETSDATGHVRGSYTFIDDKGVQHTVHYIAGPETGYRVLKNVKAPHFPSWYPFEPSRPTRPIIPSIPSKPSRPGYKPPVSPPDYGGEDYGDGDKNIEDIFGGPTEQLSTAASGHATPSKPPTGFGSSAEKGEDKPPFDSDFGGSFDDSVSSTTFRPPFQPTTTRKPFNGGSGGPQKPSFLDEEGGFVPRPGTTRRPFGGQPAKPFLDDMELEGGFRPTTRKPPFSAGAGRPSKPSFLDEEGGFVPRPSTTKKPFKPFPGEESIPEGFGTTGGPTGPTGDEEFMDDLFKPTGGDTSKPSKETEGPPKRPPQQDFTGFDSGRPPASPPSFSEDIPKPFDDTSAGGGTADDYDLFGGDKGPSSPRPPGRPSFTGNKDDNNIGFLDEKGPSGRPPQRPPHKDDFDFFGGGEKGPVSSTARPPPGGSRPSFGGPSKDESFDFFDDDKGGFRPTPPKRPTTPDGFDFFAGGDKGSTSRPFRPAPGGNKNDDAYSYERPTTSRPSYGDHREDGGIAGTINVATSFDGRTTILTNIGDRHISFPPGVAVRAHVQSIDFLPYGSRSLSPGEQLKSEANELRHQKKDDND